MIELTHLATDLATDAAEINHAPDRQQQADGAEHQNHATDQTALFDAIPEVRLALQLRDQGATARVQRQSGERIGAFQVITDQALPRWLARRHQQLASIGVIAQEGIVSKRRETADSQHRLLTTCAIGAHHGQLDALDTSAGGQIFQQSHPEGIQIIG